MNIEKSLDIIKGKLLMIDKMLKQDQEEGHGSAYEMQTEDFEAIKTLLTAYEKEKRENVKLRLQDIPLIEGKLKAYKDRVNELKQELEKEKEKNKELESDIQQKNFEIKCLNSDIKNMYCEEGVIAILEDEFDLSREAIQILKEE